MTPRLLLTTLLLGLAPRLLPAQAPLTLAEALERADRAAYANRSAAGQRMAQEGAALVPAGGILPILRLEAGMMRTTDPLNAFGFTLRRRKVTAAAFAPDRLNHPSGTDNVSTGLVIEQPLFNADAWLGRQSARHAVRAAQAQETWTRHQTGVDVVRAYWGTVLAAEQQTTLQAGLVAAREHARQAEALAAQGLVTRADLLLSGVRAGAIETALLEATSALRSARYQLAILMGEPGDTTFELPAHLPATDRLQRMLRAGVPPGSLQRADVEAASAASAAARADSRRAASLYLPRLNGFGRLDWFSADRPFEGQSAWTVGLMLTWTPFAGGSQIAQRREARGRQSAAEAMAEAAAAQAGLEQAQARDAVDLASTRLEITARGASQAAEAHRIVSRKYAGGLATIADLLQAAAEETSAALADRAAAYHAIVALAEMRQAYGADLSPLQQLEDEGD